MTVVKIGTALSAQASEALTQHADWLYKHPGGRIVGIVEFEHLERVEPAPDTERKKVVVLRPSMLQVATPDQEETLRKAASAMHLIRTAAGTLTEEGDIELGQSILDATQLDLATREAARLQVAVATFAQQARQVFLAHRLTASELRYELESIATGLAQAANPRVER